MECRASYRIQHVISSPEQQFNCSICVAQLHACAGNLVTNEPREYGGDPVRPTEARMVTVACLLLAQKQSRHMSRYQPYLASLDCGPTAVLWRS